MKSSTTIYIFLALFVVWIVNTGRLERIVQIYNGTDLPEGWTTRPDGLLQPPKPELLKLDPPKNPDFSGPIGRVNEKRKTNPLYLPPVIP
jgi:hypothetical protein